MTINTTRTPQQASVHARSAREAWEAGKRIQWASHAEPVWRDWVSPGTPDFANPKMIWQTPPEPPKPEYRAWEPHEVPAGCWLRRISESGMFWSPITVSSRGVVVATATPEKGIELANRDFDDLLRRGEHSIDGGKTWRPCGVEVAP